MVISLSNRFLRPTRSTKTSIVFVVAGVVGLLMSNACVMCAPPDGPQNPRRPNILFLLTDDQRADTIHALGNSVIQTPYLDRLVRSGLTFTNAYCMGSDVPAVCYPSRTMLLSGRSLFHLKSGGRGRDTRSPSPKRCARPVTRPTTTAKTKTARGDLQGFRAREISARRYGRTALRPARQGNRRRGDHLFQDARQASAVFRLSRVRQSARSARGDSGVPEPL